MNDLILTMNLEDSCFALNEGILKALGYPAQIQVLLNTETKQLIFRTCTVDDEQAIILPGDHYLQCEIGGAAIMKKLRILGGWDDNQPRMCYGEYLPSHQAIRFDLNDALPLELV
ncbi:MAG: hypothetical protein J6M64_12160 [Oscillospiraceae bacterium]|nr:hypothetical protein [Oscillospiraceae bacterium]